MKHFRLFVLLVIALGVFVLAVLFSHGLAVRLVWGSSGFVAGLVCGMVLMAEIHHRRKARHKRTN